MYLSLYYMTPKTALLYLLNVVLLLAEDDGLGDHDIELDLSRHHAALLQGHLHVVRLCSRDDILVVVVVYHVTIVAMVKRINYNTVAFVHKCHRHTDIKI